MSETIEYPYKDSIYPYLILLAVMGLMGPVTFLPHLNYWPRYLDAHMAQMQRVIGCFGFVATICLRLVPYPFLDKVLRLTETSLQIPNEADFLNKTIEIPFSDIKKIELQSANPWRFGDGSGRSLALRDQRYIIMTVLERKMPSAAAFDELAWLLSERTKVEVERTGPSPYGITYCLVLIGLPLFLIGMLLSGKAKVKGKPASDDNSSL